MNSRRCIDPPEGTHRPESLAFCYGAASEERANNRPQTVRPNVRSGSSTDLTAPKFDFRSSPKSGLKSDIGPCPVEPAAITGCWQRRLWSKNAVGLHLPTSGYGSRLNRT